MKVAIILLCCIAWVVWVYWNMTAFLWEKGNIFGIFFMTVTGVLKVCLLMRFIWTYVSDTVEDREKENKKRK